MSRVEIGRLPDDGAGTAALSVPRGDGAASDAHPVLPLLADLHQDRPHNTRAGHESVALALEDAHLAAPHRLAEPLDVLYGDSGIAAPMVDDYRSGDVDVSEADRVAAFEADEEIDGRVRARRGE